MHTSSVNIKKCKIILSGEFYAIQSLVDYSFKGRGERKLLASNLDTSHGTLYMVLKNQHDKQLLLTL